MAKCPEDRAALLEAAASGNPKFFLGSDSAPHPTQDKRRGPHGKDSPGVFTAPYVVPLVLDALEEGCRHGLRPERLTHRNIAGFLSGFGRTFYKIDQDTSMGNSTIIIGTHDAVQIPEVITNSNKTIAVVPFRTGQYTRGVKWT